ncbi:uncharacterized protein [Anoplolepis gracilipes]|uniref:uncharacterized protein n=1 Tax=Anoplolepis gracilipes TaxID=354296 RepID=UPI003B9FBB90
MPTSSCNFHQYDVLYEGPAIKTTDDNSEGKSPIVYSLTTQDITFALTRTRDSHCADTLLRTEHPKLFILETKKGDVFAERGTIPIDNLDIFAYMNSKFVYVEKHIRHQMTSLYHNVIQQKCELEKDVITNTLSFATLQPDEFAYRLMKGPGYMAVTAGEAIHVIKCIPVNAIIWRTKECYAELPVTVRNASLFLTPKSRIFTKFGTQKECSFELPTLYRIDDTWIQLILDPQVIQLPSQRLRPMTSLSWKYLTPGPLAISGIYTEKDIEKLRDHIMFPAEKPALLNFIARGMTGQVVILGEVSIYSLLDEESLQKIASNTVSRIRGEFVTFGSATAGILEVFLIIQLIKLTIDTAIHGYALHTVYGCSLHLLGAVWSSLTHLLLHLARGPVNQRRIEPEEDQSSLEPMSPSPVTPTAPKIESTIVNATAVNTTTPMPIVYTDLRERLNDIEQIPSITSGICS